MIKSTKTSRISAVFLAAVLVAGTLALSSPSFMTGAEAYPYNRGDDNNNHDFPSFKKSFEKKSAEYKKCININLNFPGLDFSPSFVTEAESLGVDSLTRDGGNNGPHGGFNGGHDDGFKKFDKDFICINANDNSVRGGIGDGEEPEPEPEPDVCQAIKDCFREWLQDPANAEFNPNGYNNLNQLISSVEGGVTFNFRGEEFTVTTPDELCKFFEDAVESGDISTFGQLNTAIRNFLNAALSPENPITNPDFRDTLGECLAEALGIEIPGNNGGGGGGG